MSHDTQVSRKSGGLDRSVSAALLEPHKAGTVGEEDEEGNQQQQIHWVLTVFEFPDNSQVGTSVVTIRANLPLAYVWLYSSCHRCQLTSVDSLLVQYGPRVAYVADPGDKPTSGDLSSFNDAKKLQAILERRGK